MKILCIINPIAGGGKTTKRVISVIHKTFGAAGVLYDIIYTQKKGDGTELSHEAEREGYSHVVAVGGDGTVNEIATGLVKTSTTLAIIPVGSGNGLARALKIPLRHEDACQLILHGVSKQIDVGLVCDRYFFATSGIGFDAHVGKLFNERTGHSRGFLPYAQFAAAEYFKYTPQEVVVQYEGKRFTYTPLVVTVANAEQYGGGAIIAPHAIPDDGLFDVTVFTKPRMLNLAPHITKLFMGTLDKASDFITHRTASLKLIRSAPGPVHVDGESFMAGAELEYSLLPLALRIQVDEHAFKTANASKHKKTKTRNTTATLEKLVQLKEKGLITEADFKAQKKKLLDQL